MNFDLPTLDQMTGGIFGATTSSERAALVRTWLDGQPSIELVQAVYKELSARDKGAARPLRERLDEVRKVKLQEALVQEWMEKAEFLLAQSRMNIADAMAWQRDAAKAGAPLSKSPLLELKDKLAERVAHVEALQHSVGVQREAAAMFAQRLEMLSTKPLDEVVAQQEQLVRDAAEWHAKSEELTTRPHWRDVDAKLPVQLQAAQNQLTTIFEAFCSVLTIAIEAKANSDAPLPSIPVWADEIRAQRATALDAVEAEKPKIDPARRQAARAAVLPVLKKLEEELAAGHGKTSAGAAQNLRQMLKDHGAFLDGKLDAACHMALGAAGELEGWQRWRADQIRQQLLEQAQNLLQNPLSGRKQQDALRSLRDQWKQADQGGIPNHVLWKRFDDACNEAHKVVEVWLEEIKAKSAVVIAERTALIEQLKTWTAQQAALAAADAATVPDWKAVYRSLQQFSNQWREAGHLSDRDFEPLQATWKQTFKEAAAPLDQAQKAGLARRQELIGQAKDLLDAVTQGGELRVDFVRELQQKWQAEAQTVTLERKTEQRLWEQFKSALDAAFVKKDELRNAAKAAYMATMSAHDQAVMDATKALEEASATEQADAIHVAMQALQAALRGQTVSRPVVAVANVVPADAGFVNLVLPDTAAVAGAPSEGDAPQSVEGQPSQDSVPSAPAKVVKPVIAVRGDDRQPTKVQDVARKNAPATRGGRDGRDNRDGKDARDSRDGRDFRDGKTAQRPERAPRLSDAAFHAQRKAIEQAESVLKKLQAQAHGEVVTAVLAAWQARSSDQLPALSKLGKAVTSAVRTQWTQALAGAPASSDAAAVALLRLEIATQAPTPAEFLDARRLLQLQLLTKRNSPTPQQTWGADVAQVLAGASDEISAKRLQAVLKLLLK